MPLFLSRNTHPPTHTDSYNTSVRVIGEGKTFIRKGSETECIKTGKVYVLSGFDVRHVEASPKRLRIEKASEHVKQHCIFSPKGNHHKTKKSFVRDRVDSREVLQGSSFFNDLVKRSAIRKESVSTDGLVTHEERPISSPKKYRNRKTCKRDEVFKHDTSS